jgi:hypothetical protein
MFAGIPQSPPVAPGDDPRLVVTVALAARVVALRMALHTISSAEILSLPRAIAIADAAIDADDAMAAREPTLPAEETT